jgi:ATP synthase protein I
MHPHVRPQVRWILSCQLLATLLVAVLAGFADGSNAAVSALLGGGIAVLAGAAYVWRAMRHSEGEPGKLYRAQMLGEGYKFAVTFGLFALVFTGLRNVSALPLFLAYILTFGVYWIALLKRRY